MNKLYLVKLTHWLDRNPLTREESGGYNFNLLFASHKEYDQSQLDKLVESAINAAPRRLEIIPFENFLKTRLKDNNLSYIGQGDLDDKLNGESVVEVPDGVIIPSDISYSPRDYSPRDEKRGITYAILKYDPSRVVKTSRRFEYVEIATPLDHLCEVVYRLRKFSLRKAV